MKTSREPRTQLSILSETGSIRLCIDCYLLVRYLLELTWRRSSRPRRKGEKRDSLRVMILRIIRRSTRQRLILPKMHLPGQRTSPTFVNSPFITTTSQTRARSDCGETESTRPVSDPSLPRSSKIEERDNRKSFKILTILSRTRLW